MRRVCIHQPDFLPYLGFFDRLIDSDVFIILDDVQFSKHGWHHRDKIKTANGAAWLTLPVQAASLGTLIMNMELSKDRQKWSEAHANKLYENYRKAKFYTEFSEIIFSMYKNGETSLSKFNEEFIRFFLDVFEIKTEIILSSKLKCSGGKNERLIALLQAVDGTHYISGTGAVNYMKPEFFSDAGIILEIQEFSHPIYPQQHGDFLPFLSCLDVLLNCGRESAGILRKQRGGKRPY
ncbi:WbqC family protein [Azospirillum doebereinerae]|uniref:WbqC family protein n=1 Tax=Azospirillum doebereinerae TaxID=92933 RepID=A0A3S0XA87_9PROT|nr:WbqC family protein [Azospirillum doebereinerae]MCG5238919.1 WbqC family protein [Azospirillum doebereinerae]RUQ68937.1 hypothetical protein EJ913_17345 [Azospirillum doebereinerae]